MPTTKADLLIIPSAINSIDRSYSLIIRLLWVTEDLIGKCLKLFEFIFKIDWRRAFHLISINMCVNVQVCIHVQRYTIVCSLCLAYTVHDISITNFENSYSSIKSSEENKLIIRSVKSKATSVVRHSVGDDFHPRLPKRSTALNYFKHC